MTTSLRVCWGISAPLRINSHEIIVEEFDRLSRIETQWTVLRQAHGPSDDETREALTAIVQCYGGAIRRYLRAALRDADAVDEVYQDFTLRLVRGELGTADPDRGRFRNFLKSILFRMVADHYRKSKRRPAPQEIEAHQEPSIPDDQEARDQEFLESWRDELLDQTWLDLKEISEAEAKPYYQTLRLRVNSPDASYEELAPKMSELLQREITQSNAKQRVKRARDRFSKLLLARVAASIDSPEAQEIEQELADLRLLPYCRSALDK
jgi:RNA polymerase sigma factor (sigma-70 family)